METPTRLYGLELRAKSIVVTLPDQDREKWLMRVAQDNILDPKFRALFENKFTPLHLVIEGKNMPPTYFPDKLRLMSHQLQEQAKSLEKVASEYVPTRRAKNGVLEVNIMQVRALLNGTQFGACAEVHDSYMPAFDEKGLLYRKNDPRQFVRDTMGHLIPCYHVLFNCSILDVEKDFIEILAPGLFLDSYCGNMKCQVYLAKTLTR